MILAIETSTMYASAAVVAGDDVLAERISEARAHSEKLIDDVLGSAGVALSDLEGIAVGAGPGSFTGLRIGMATAKGLCFAAELPLWAVSSLAALAFEAAAGAGSDELLVPVLDAYRKEVFAGVFEPRDGSVRALGDEIVVAPRELFATLGDRLEARRARIFGDGFALYADTIDSRPGVARWSEADGAPQRPGAASVARLARRADPEAQMALVAPVYIRKSEAEIRYPDGNPGGSYTPNPPVTSKQRKPSS